MEGNQENLVPRRPKVERCMEFKVPSHGKHNYKIQAFVRWELEKKCVLWILQMERIVDLARARGIHKLKTVSEGWAFKSLTWEGKSGL